MAEIVIQKEFMKTSDVRILIVDDEPLLLEMISDLFETYEFQVDKATSGNQGWELCQKNLYNLVLTDVRMADGDGIELTKKIKAHHPTVPSVLIMSGFTDLLNEEIYHFGAEGKFTKPFDNKAIRNAVQTCLLTPVARWDKPLTGDRRTLNIKKTGESFSELESQKKVLFGRGGFFIAHALSPPDKGSIVTFTIEVQKPKLVTLKGEGIVRWIQHHGKHNIPAGIGIEIISLPQPESKIYQEYFGKLVPYIPSPGKL